MFPASKEQLTFLALRANLLQHQAGRREHDRIGLASTLRTYGDTTHTGDARLLIHFLRIFLVDGLYGSLCCTDATVGAIFCCFGHHTGSSGFLIRTITRNRRF